MGVFDELAARLERAEAHVEELQGEMRYVWDLISNPCLSSSQKITLLAVRDLIKRTGRDLERFTEISMIELGKQTGVSRQTVGDNVASLAEMGALARRERTELEPGRNGGKKYRTIISVAPTLLTEHPAMIQASRNQGGKREKKCPNCGGMDLLLYKQLWCACCKREISSEWQSVNDDRTLDEFVDDVLERDRKAE
jgi:predicted DNA-binding protein YlxM (UPF0122 family)